MLVTNTPTVEGRKSVKYCGIVTGEAILGANVFKELLARPTALSLKPTLA
jgi:uncharacterized protein YbjQ (UPF0145 family)